MNCKLLTLPLICAAIAAALPVQAEEGPWLIRARVLDMQVDNTNQDTPPALQSLGQVTAENKVFPEVDFTYFFSKNFATELILTYPQAHTVSLAGKAIGSLKHLPPTLTAQYHFLPDGEVRPYVGLGINYTRFMDVSLLNGAVTTDKDSFGLAAQAGLDYRIAPAWFLNVDAKYVQIETHVKLAASNTTITKLKIDPWLLSLGVGYRF